MRGQSEPSDPDSPEHSSESRPQVIVRPPADASADLGKDEVDYGWGEQAGSVQERDVHVRERPPHHDSIWG